MKSFYLKICVICVIILVCGSDNIIAQTSNSKIDSLRHVIKTAKHDTTKIYAYLAWGDQVYIQNPDTALILWQQSLRIADKNLTGFKNLSGLSALKDTLLKQKANALSSIGYIFHNKGEIPKALEYNNRSLNIREEIGDKYGVATSFNNIGHIYYNQGDIPKALEYFNKSLKILEEISYKVGMAGSYNNIGYIYDNQGDIPKALEYYNKSLKIQEEIGDKQGMAMSYNNIGSIYDYQANEVGAKQNFRQDFVGSNSLIKKALEYYNKSLKIREEIGDKQGMAMSFNNIGTIYNNQTSIAISRNDNIGSDSLAKKALEYYNKSLKNFEKIGDKNGIATSYYNIGNIYLKMNNITNAKSYFEKSYKFSKELGYPENIESATSGLRKIYEKQGNYKLAYQYYQEEILMHDSIQNEENYKQTQKQQAKYEYEKKAATDSVSHAKAIEIKDLDLAKQKAESQKQRIVIYSFFAGFIIILVFSIFLFRLFIQKKKANIQLALKKAEVEQKNEEITSQRDEIEAQRNEVQKHRDLVVHQKEEIESSITYAKRIQNAVLPTVEHLNMFLSDYFILFRPKDIVSGDFYWATIIKNWQILTVADCTGHGVPGAFMSMLGVSFLNEIVRKKEVTEASEVLNNLRKSIIESLSQTGESGTQKDGMDMSFAVINIETNQLQWAGANNPLWLVRSSKNLSGLEDEDCQVKTPDRGSVGLGEDASANDKLQTTNFKLFDFKPDKMPIAIYEKMDSFTNHEIQLNSGDILYLMSDGYEDQFGGPKGKKFLSKNLKQLLLDNCHLPMDEQKEILENTLENWIGEGEQIDDITVLGIKK